MSISIHAPRTGSDLSTEILHGDKAISIHAPRTGSDVVEWTTSPSPMYFNPRSPHGERQRHHVSLMHKHNFNPRSPHGERRVAWEHTNIVNHFNPRSPHGERLVATDVSRSAMAFQSTLPARGATIRCGIPSEFGLISIHAPRTGSD